jgi:hypothetical protein
VIVLAGLPGRQRALCYHRAVVFPCE